MFDVAVYDGNGKRHEIGAIKIGFKGQTTDIATHQKLPPLFPFLSSDFFSLGQRVEFYQNIRLLPGNLGENILESLRDIVKSPEIIKEIDDENVFSVSFLRNTSLSVIKGQYARALEGKPLLTDFKFRFSRPETMDLGAIELSFNVDVGSTPSTNVHAIIGRNGVGKTTLLNGMIGGVMNPQSDAKFFDIGAWQSTPISSDYFSSLVSVSFSAFDPFDPPQEQSDPAKGTCYFYIGLKDPKDKSRLRTIADLRKDCVKALVECFYDPGKRSRWLNAIMKLGSDDNFAFMQLEQLEGEFDNLRKMRNDQTQPDSESFLQAYFSHLEPYLKRMSSGHAIVLLTITKLVAKVEEKTLVLMDEPESHLHPPLLSAFIRALSDLLHDRNAVAIIATHSPVVLQEIPRSCVWKIYRVGKDVSKSKPDRETFAENVGVLTSEVFSLEVERSGFHELLANSVNEGATYQEIVDNLYGGQLGFEGRAILRALVADRDRRLNNAPIE